MRELKSTSSSGAGEPPLLDDLEEQFPDSDSSGSDEEAAAAARISKPHHAMRTADRRMASDPMGPNQIPWVNPAPLKKPAASRTVIDDDQVENPRATTLAPSDAETVGLTSARRQDSLFVFQLPLLLPLGSGDPAQLGDVPEGSCGKFLVYKSGKMKIRFGDRLFDVMAGTRREVAQDLAVVKPGEGVFQIMGKIEPNPLIIVPDFDDLLGT
ncbi:MAG: hypothetical protein Q8P67_23925 [archaeon]|nr:hypothetical protein [archaeon]